MNRPIKTTSRPQMALQSYLDGLLQEATEELPASPSAVEALPEPVEAEVVLDEFQAAVLEEQARDAQASAIVAAVEAPFIKPQVAVMEAPAPILAPVSTVAPLLQGLVTPVVEIHLPPSNTPPPVQVDDRPAWAAEPFECLLFDVAGLTLAVPLVCLGSIYS